MISMRYHIVSLSAIFLALALGIVLGATKVSSPILAGLQSDKTTLSAEKDQLATENTTLNGRVTGDDKFAGSVGSLAVRGTLPNTSVVLITTSDADPGDRDALLSLLARSGAKVTAQIQVTAQFSDPQHASDLRALAAKVLPTGATLPASPKVGAVAGGLLASVLLTNSAGKTAKPAEATAALSALASSGFIQASGTVAAGRMVIILTGAAVTGGSEADRAAAIADLAVQLKQTASAVVLAGRQGSESSTGSVGMVRGDTTDSAAVSTVDNVDTSTGRLATVLSVVEQNGGGVGRYGFAANAQAQVPTLAVN